MSFINEIFILDDIFSIEKQVEQENGIHIPNVSHWDSSVAFQKYMAQVLVLPVQSLPWNYYYTYSISLEERQQVLKKLGIPLQQIQSVMGLLLQSSTIAIVNLINLLVHYKRKRLCILQPAYFSVSTCCTMLSLKYGIEQISFECGRPRLPIDKIISGEYDCIWITSPIFCTGYYPDDEYLKDINYLKSIGLTLIFDESLALPGKELIRSFPIDNKIFAIYSPHKSISINGLKFAVIVCDRTYEDFLEQWVDVFSGALSSSNRDAVFHYISSNYFDKCYPAYKCYINESKKVVNDILKQFPFASILPNTEGHYIQIFTNLKIQGKKELLSVLNEMIHTHFVSLIPAALNGFDPNQSFGFRVNLTGDIRELGGAVGRIMQYLSMRYQ
ncbi:MAG: hypothetical protein J1E83_14050 [Lachnospiraceae bacterium]|nr:hypothetical protein [Lachnospiraceae bacterium]